MYKRMNILRILALVGLAACLAPREAAAALAHRYSFSGNLEDSVGGATGIMVDTGAATAMFAGGQLDLSANTGQGSNAITEDAYVNLPNGLATGIATGGTSGAFSMELWATVSETHTWQRYIDMGTSNTGEDTSPGGGAASYIYIAANSGRFGDGVASEAHVANQAGAATEVGLAGETPINQQLHMVGTYDQNDTSAGANGTLKLYRNGALLGSAAIPAGLNLNTFTNDNNWLGRSQWPDPVFDGLYNEVRLYDHVLSAAEVATNMVHGPDVLATGELLSLVVNTTSGLITIKNNASVALNADFYRISSSVAGLNLGGWNSLDNQNYDAVDGIDPGTVAGDTDGEGWDAAGGSSSSQLVEQFLGEGGSMIGPGEELPIGNAFNTTINDQNLQFTFGLLGGLEVPGSVDFEAGAIPGDYNGNGTVELGDFNLVVANWGDAVPPTPGSWNGDPPTAPQVDLDDFNKVVANWGDTDASSAAQGSNVPEPLALFSALIAAAALLVRRPNRTNQC